METENMIRKSLWLTPEQYSAIHAAAAEQGKAVAEVLRELADDFVAGNTVVDSKEEGEKKQTGFYIPPTTLNFLETHGKSQGYSFGMLMSALIEKKYLAGTPQDKNQ